MKKITALILVLSALFALCACAKDEPKTEEPVEHWDLSELPRIDGSTATIPLSEGIACDLLGCTPEKAHEIINHNKTHSAYQNLIDGKCDIIFVTPPSEEEYKMLADAGDDFEIVRIVKDAFVFLVNSQNKVENISLSNVRDVYKGKITNWKELGGEDLPIIAYQRPDNSGSQTLMYKLCVPADEITKAPTELKPGGMGDLVDVVSSYENGKGALGYSVYYYASGMYTSEGSKLIAIDGVFPSDETIANDTYPLVDGYYAIYRSKQTKDSPVFRLVDYLLSERGQKTAKASGYVPLA